MCNAFKEDPSQQQVHLVQLRELAKKHDPIARFLTSSALCGEGPGYDPLEALSLSRSGPLEMYVRFWFFAFVIPRRFPNHSFGSLLRWKWFQLIRGAVFACLS